MSLIRFMQTRPLNAKRSAIGQGTALSLGEPMLVVLVLDDAVLEL